MDRPNRTEGIDDVVLVMRKAAVQSAIVRATGGVADETRCRVAERSQVFGERERVRAEWTRPLRIQLVRPVAREQARVGGERPGSCRTGLVEADALSSQSLEVGTGAALIAVEAQMIGPHRVQNDNQHVGQASPGRGAALLSPRLELLLAEDPARLKDDQAEEDRQAERHPPPDASVIPLHEPRQPRPSSEREDHPGFEIDAARKHEESGQDGQAANDPPAQPSCPARPESRRRSKDCSDDQEAQQID
jgi:hypothetical protein